MGPGGEREMSSVHKPLKTSTEGERNGTAYSRLGVVTQRRTADVMSSVHKLPDTSTEDKERQWYCVIHLGLVSQLPYSFWLEWT